MTASLTSVYPSPMERFRHVPSLTAFATDKMKKVGLVDTPNLFCDVYGFEPGQEQAGHRHAIGDKLYYVLAGRGRVRVGTEEREVSPGDLVCAPAGEDHAVRNPGPERLTLLVVMAPKPS
jgi:quercetin dioxygenase-like cupin family protein